MTNIHIIDLNLRFGLADDGPNSWTQRRRAYPELLKAWPADFYTFQEANDFQVEELAALLPEYSCIGRREPAPEDWQHNIIFYRRRISCLQREHFYLSETPDVPSQCPGSRWPRQCSLGLFELEGRRLLLATTHFDFDPDVQQKSARLIRRRLARHFGELPMILSGDFNAGFDSEASAVFTENGGFAHAFAPPADGTHHGFTGHSKGPAIDWILYRGVELLQARRITRTFAGYYPSDHFPLSAVFQVPQDK